MIVFDDVSKWFGDVVAVSEMTFRVGPGLTALLGPNGAGKSTALRLLCGLTPPSRGTVRVLGSDPHADTALYRRIGLVPQQEAVFAERGVAPSVRRGACPGSQSSRAWRGKLRLPDVVALSGFFHRRGWR